MVSDLDKKLLGISSEKRALELSNQTTMIKLQARNEEVERPMEQNGEVLAIQSAFFPSMIVL